MSRHMLDEFPQTHVAAHRKFGRRYGSASEFECVGCGEPAIHWSYDHGSPNEVTCPVDGFVYALTPDRTGLDPDFYSPRCYTCHSRHDGHGEKIKARRAERHAEGDPEFMARTRIGAAHMLKGQVLRACADCDLITRPGPMKVHQNHTGHDGLLP